MPKTDSINHSEQSKLKQKRIQPPPTYRIWIAMRSRVRSPRNTGYANYGGRGIKICERWNSYANFLADMGERPSTDYSIDRIDVNGNYEPSNCRWATQSEQHRNRRDNRMLTFKEQTRCITDWAEITGLSFDNIRGRLRNGWSVEKALTTPVNHNYNPRVGRLITFNGVTKNTLDWSRATGIPQPTIWWRLQHGFSAAEILRPKKGANR